ncbi:hypothetical protein Srot_1179 [Segniliparus rotundus DSM 44985]|uniref:Uncharacterized protein n=1 Tax=Segniliparus rotundus (strain ATCC BAA-972 / CDC 1076 / CIP 108378 / DSM 44985 / JCM 13578) TaxID=640132 RepID=D6ZFC6_SEGRD|nr:hypothetical protein [Segniliparus rotundus]ADG97650.1 hypothetical protein Srot_1179 [Segniliparus rotundus DSM 44985]
MEKVWLSSTYYLDAKVAGLSANAERLFTRALAFCGNAETKGVFDKKQAMCLGIVRVSSYISELIRAQIVDETSPGVYRFRNWERWQKTGDELLERREKDRERKRRQRERSQETSRDVTPLEKNREEKTSTSHVPKAPHLSDAGGREGPLPGRVPIKGWALVRETIPGEHPQQIRSALAVKAAELLRAGTPRADVADALRLWLAKPRAGAGLLPSLVSEVVKNRADPAQPARGSPSEKALGWLAIAADYEAKAHNAQDLTGRELD